MLGIIENMSYFVCPHCNERSDIFTHGGAKTAATQLGVDFLGEVPIEMAIRECADSGQPIVALDPKSRQAEIYHQIADRLWNKIDNSIGQFSGPEIVVE